MKFNEFVDKVCNCVQDYMGEEVAVSINKVRKNNGICLEGLVIVEKDNNISPTIYLNGYYEEYEKGKTFSEIFNHIVKIYEESKVDKNINMDFFLDYQLVKEKIAYKIINYDKNIELLYQIPHVKYLDLAIVFYCLIISEQFSGASITIYNSHLKMWNITAEELYQQAKINTPKLLQLEVKNMNQILDEMLNQNYADDIPEEWREEMNEQLEHRNDEEVPMYVLTNHSKMNGAACILYEKVLENFANEKGCDLYVLPSSIHEVILIPTKSKFEQGKFEIMVKDVNETQVEMEEVLSNSVYYFSREEREVFKL